MNPDPTSSGARGRYWGVAALLIVVALVIFVRLRLLQFPLERDEGEYAYAGQLMLDGVPPYQLAFNMKLPGTYAAYAIIMAAFGQTIGGIHFGFLLVNLAAITLVFLIARQLLDFTAAVIAAISYALLSLSPGVLGLAGHATHLVTLAALAGLWFLLRARRSGKPLTLLWSGLCFGTAFVCKQPGLYFGMFGFLIVVRDESPSWPPDWPRLIRKTAFFSVGMILPFALTCLIIWHLGTFPQFWFWTITYAKVHALSLTAADAIGYFRNFLSVAGWVKASVPLAAIGLLCLLARKDEKDQQFFLVALLEFSFLAYAAAFYFSRHYFIVMLPIVSLLGAIAVTTAMDTIARSRLPRLRVLPPAIFAAACACFVFANRAVWFQMTPAVACRVTYGANPFPEAIEVADYIRTNSAPSARVAVIGSEPEIYFYSHRHSATGYIYMYDLVQLHDYASKMQRDFARQVEAVAPEYLVMIGVQSSWLPVHGWDKFIRDWNTLYVSRFYRQVGIILLNENGDERHFGDDAANQRAGDSSFVTLYKRKENP